MMIRSIRRNQGSPFSAKIWGMERLVRCSMRASLSRNSISSRRAQRRPMVLFPVPIKPMSTRLGRRSVRVSGSMVWLPAASADRIQIAVKVILKLFDAVATELFKKRIGQGEGDHSLADSGRCRNGTNVRALKVRFHRLMCLHIYRGQGGGQRGKRFHRSSNYNRLPVSHAALNAACIVGAAEKTGRPLEEQFIMDFGAWNLGHSEPHADLHPFNGLDGHNSCRQSAIEFPIPMYKAA